MSPKKRKRSQNSPSSDNHGHSHLSYRDNNPSPLRRSRSPVNRQRSPSRDSRGRRDWRDSRSFDERVVLRDSSFRRGGDSYHLNTPKRTSESISVASGTFNPSPGPAGYGTGRGRESLPTTPVKELKDQDRPKPTEQNPSIQSPSKQNPPESNQPKQSLPELNPPAQSSSGSSSPLQVALQNQPSQNHPTQSMAEHNLPADKSVDRRETPAETPNGDGQWLPSIILEQLLLQIPSLAGLELKKLNAKRVLEKSTMEYKKSAPQHERYPALEESLRRSKETAEKEFRSQCESYKKVEVPFEKIIQEFSKCFALQGVSAKSDTEAQKKIQNQLDGLEERYEDLAKYTKDLQKSEHELREDNAKLRHDHGILEAEIAALKGQHDQLDSGIGTLKEQDDLFKNEQSILRTDQAKLLSKLQEIEGECGKLKSRSYSEQGYQTQIKELSDGLHANQKTTSQMEVQLANIGKILPHDLVQTLASHSKNIQQLDNVKAWIQGMSTKIAAFENEHENFRASLGILAGVERELKSAESSIKDLKHKLEKLGESSLSCEHPAVLEIKAEVTSLREKQEKCLAIGIGPPQTSVLTNGTSDNSVSSKLLSDTVQRMTTLERDLTATLERTTTLENDQAASFDEISRWHTDLSDRMHSLSEAQCPLEYEMKLLEQKFTRFERASSNSNATDKVLSELPAKFQLLEQTVKKETTEAKDALTRARTAAEPIVSKLSTVQDIQSCLTQKLTEVDGFYQTLKGAVDAHGVSILHLNHRISNINTADLASHMLSQIEDMFPGLRNTHNSLSHFTNILNEQKLELGRVTNDLQGLKNERNALSQDNAEQRTELEHVKNVLQELQNQIDALSRNGIERKGAIDSLILSHTEQKGRTDSLQQIANRQKGCIDSLEQIVAGQNSRLDSLQNLPDRKELEKLASDILAVNNKINFVEDTANQALSLVRVTEMQREKDQKELTSEVSTLVIKIVELEEKIPKLEECISLLCSPIKVFKSGRGSSPSIPDIEKRPGSSKIGDQRRESREPSSVRHSDSNGSKRKSSTRNGSSTSNYPSSPAFKRPKTRKSFPFGKALADDDDENFVAPSPTMDDDGEE